MDLNKIYQGDSLEVLKTFPDEIVDCVVTSPPYWGLRDYGIDNQLGLESTPEEYVEKMVEVFRQIKRVLKHDGTVWLNLGDSYSDVSMGAWPKHINDFFPDVIVKDYGSCARGNDYISRTIISSVQKLLDDGIKPNNILVLGCWSGLQRRDILINKESIKQHFSLSHHTKNENQLDFTKDLPIPYHFSADFNGDGLSDDAWILISTKSDDTYGVFVFFNQRKGDPKVIDVPGHSGSGSYPQGKGIRLEPA